MWLELKGKELVKEELEITEEERRIAKKIFKHILKRWKKPGFRNVQLVPDSKCGKVEKSLLVSRFGYFKSTAVETSR